MKQVLLNRISVSHRKAAALAILFIITPISSLSQDLTEHKQRKEQLEEEIANINRQLADNKSQRRNDLVTLSLTKEKISKRKKLIRSIDEEIHGHQVKIDRKNREIDNLNERLDTLTSYYESLVYSAYKTRDTRIWFIYILSGQNISQSIRRFLYLQSLSESMRMQAKEVLATKEKLEKEQKVLDGMIAEANKVRTTRSREYEALSKEEEQLSASLKSLAAQEQTIRRELARKSREMERLNREIERLITAAVRGEGDSKDNITEKEIALSGQFGENKGRLPWPVMNGVVIEPYGQSYHPVFKNLKLPFNNGVNISASADSKAVSVFEGIVKQVLVMPGYNQCVLVQHGEYYTFYCRLKKVNVKGGDTVNSGDAIGVIDTSESGNAVLHFELWKGTVKQDPELWLR